AVSNDFDRADATAFRNHTAPPPPKPSPARRALDLHPPGERAFPSLGSLSLAETPGTATAPPPHPLCDRTAAAADSPPIRSRSSSSIRTIAHEPPTRKLFFVDRVAST